MAKKYTKTHLGPNVEVYLGDTNLGVTGNSNRCLRWFMLQENCDHLCLLNDDLHVLGDFVDFYAKGHAELGVGLFCFCDFTKASPAISGPPETYRWLTVRSRGYQVKLLPRMTGIMMSMTRSLVERIGYYDPRFAKFGEEHTDYTIRARLAGFVSLDGQPQNCLDLEHKLLRHQDIASSIQGHDREQADQEAASIMGEICKRYGQEPLYRPFRLRQPKMVGGHAGLGIPFEHLGGYALEDLTL
jgi:hypothetical protein